MEFEFICKAFHIGLFHCKVAVHYILRLPGRQPVTVSFPLVIACFTDRKNFAKFLYRIIFLKLASEVFPLELKDVLELAAVSYFLRSLTKKLIVSLRISFASLSSAISFIICLSRSVSGSNETFVFSFFHCVPFFPPVSQCAVNNSKLLRRFFYSNFIRQFYCLRSEFPCVSCHSPPFLSVFLLLHFYDNRSFL